MIFEEFSRNVVKLTCDPSATLTKYDEGLGLHALKWTHAGVAHTAGLVVVQGMLDDSRHVASLLETIRMEVGQHNLGFRQSTAGLTENSGSKPTEEIK